MNTNVILRSVAYVSALGVLLFVFGLEHGVLVFLAMILFGWGMNLENKYA